MCQNELHLKGADLRLRDGMRRVEPKLHESVTSLLEKILERPSGLMDGLLVKVVFLIDSSTSWYKNK